MNEDTCKMTPEKVNIDSFELDDEALSQAAGGFGDGDTELFLCRECKKVTTHTYFQGKGLVCDACGDSGGLLIAASASLNGHNA